MWSPAKSALDGRQANRCFPEILENGPDREDFLAC